MAGWGAHSGDTEASELTNTYRRIEALYLRQTFLRRNLVCCSITYLLLENKQQGPMKTILLTEQTTTRLKVIIIIIIKPPLFYCLLQCIRESIVLEKNKDKEKKQLKFYSQFSVPQEANQQHYHITTGKAILPASQKTVIY